MAIATATLDTEIRKLRPNEIYNIARCLDDESTKSSNNCKKNWKILMSTIQRDDDDGALFNNDHILMIEQEAFRKRVNPAELFLSEWSTWGKRRPTCKKLLDILTKIEHFRAADYLAEQILKIGKPQRPVTGPAAEIDVSDKVLEELLKQQAEYIQVDSSVKFYIQEEETKQATYRQGMLENIEQVSKEISDLILFSYTQEINETEEPFLLETIATEDLPEGVRETALKSNDTRMTSEESKLQSSLMTGLSRELNSADSTADTINRVQTEQDVSQNLPIVVLEFNERLRSTD